MKASLELVLHYVMKQTKERERERVGIIPSYEGTPPGVLLKPNQTFRAGSR